jgi:hypothetical protein
MANPKDILKRGLKTDGTIKELVSRAFTTRNLLHFAHWNTNSFATHMAVGDFYDDIISEIDDIVECYQGEFGLVQGLSTQAALVPSDILAHIKEEMNWVKINRSNIASNSPTIEALVDNLLAKYSKTVYKLTNLH